MPEDPTLAAAFTAGMNAHATGAKITDCRTVREVRFDVWILPGIFYGTTPRIYDPGLVAWHILWSDLLRPFYTQQIGRACGNDIVQEGRSDAGTAIRWRFTEITHRSFRCLGECSPDDGATW